MYLDKNFILSVTFQTVFTFKPLTIGQALNLIRQPFRLIGDDSKISAFRLFGLPPGVQGQLAKFQNARIKIFVPGLVGITGESLAHMGQHVPHFKRGGRGIAICPKSDFPGFQVFTMQGRIKSRIYAPFVCPENP